MTDSAIDPRDPYATRLAAANTGYAQIDARWNRVANLRLIAFMAAAAAAAWGLWGRAPLGWPFAAAFLAAFSALALYHARLGRERERLATLRAIEEEAIARIERRWNNLPEASLPAAPTDHPYAADLDIVGHASLFQLLDTTATRMGRETLAAWLLHPADAATALARQGAVADLTPRLDERQEIELRGRAAANQEADPEPFLTWAEQPDGLVDQRWLRWYAWLGPLALLALVAAERLGLTPYPFWAIPLLGNLLVGSTVARRAYATIAGVVTDHRAIAAYAGQIALLATAEFSDPLLRSLQERLGRGETPPSGRGGLGGEWGPPSGRGGLGGEKSAPAMLRRLGRLAGMAIPPSSMLYVPIQALTLWDVHVLAALERWKRAGGQEARRWLTTLGEAEALAALAALRHDNPSWVFPRIDPQAHTYAATTLGHPLLRADMRVCNDVAIGPPGTFLLVTGSNMSGKSTLLRAIGVNAVLAQAGGAVCADALTLPPVALWTSARVQDSLERGVSFFLAELQRLKLIVDAATRAHEQGGSSVMYLLDEILQGTNTAERSVAARRVIAYLVDQGAIGAVSTHDLALADDPRLAISAQTVHFTDTVGEGPDAPPMSFDYRLRPGVATTTNALRLMRLIGLELEDAPV